MSQTALYMLLSCNSQTTNQTLCSPPFGVTSLQTRNEHLTWRDLWRDWRISGSNGLPSSRRGRALKGRRRRLMPPSGQHSRPRRSWRALGSMDARCSLWWSSHAKKASWQSSRLPARAVKFSRFRARTQDKRSIYAERSNVSMHMG